MMTGNLWGTEQMTPQNSLQILAAAKPDIVQKAQALAAADPSVDEAEKPKHIPAPRPAGPDDKPLYEETAGPEQPADAAQSKWGKWAEGLGKVGNVLSTAAAGKAAVQQGAGSQLGSPSSPSGADTLSPIVAKYMEMVQPQNPVAAWLQF